MKTSYLSQMLLGATAALAMAAGVARAEEGATFAALQIAYGRELNSRTAYLEFAFQADREGHASAACVLRAVATAESVHAANHARAIEQLGGQAAWRREPGFQVRKTVENLSRSMEMEFREYADVYTQFAKYARAEYLYEALAAFNYARSAERTHERMFAEALDRVYKSEEPLPPSPPLLFMAVWGEPDTPMANGFTTCYGCQGCGSVWSHFVKRCPNCGGGAARFARTVCPGSH